MIGLIFIADVLIELGNRPINLTGPLGTKAYESALDQGLKSRAVSERLARFFGNCETVEVNSAGFTLVSLMEGAGAQIPASLTKSTEGKGSFTEIFDIAPPKDTAEEAGVEHVKAVGCARTYRMNFLMHYNDGDQEPTAAFLAAGNSIAPIQVQAEIEKRVVDLLLAGKESNIDTKCDAEPLLYDVQVIRRGNASTHEWTERWLAYYCNRVQSTNITFTWSPEGNRLTVFGESPSIN